MTTEPLQPWQLTNIYREARHSQRNALLLSGLSVTGAIVGLCVLLSDLEIRIPATLAIWTGAVVCSHQAQESSKQATQYRKRKEVLEQSSENVVLQQIHQSVQPALPALTFKPEAVERPLILPNGTRPIESFAACLQQLLARDLELRTDYVEAIAGPQLIQVSLRPHDLKKMKQLQGEATSESIQGLLQLPHPPIVTNDKGNLAIALARPDRQFCHFADYIESPPAPGPLRMAIGVDIRGNLVEVELSGETLQHFVVGGAPRQGKSQTLLTMMGSLVYRYSPEQIQFICGDGKGGVTLGFMDGSPYLMQPVATTQAAGKQLAAFLKQLVDERYEQFRQVGAQTIDDYISITGQQMPYVMVVWDEFQDLFDLSLGVKSETLPTFESLSSLAPAAGVLIVWSSQRIDGRLLPPQVNSKCLSRLCLKVQKDADSKFVLNGNDAGVNLLGKGDLLFDDGRSLQRLQGLLMANRDSVFKSRQSVSNGDPPQAIGPPSVTNSPPIEDTRMQLEMMFNLSSEDCPKEEELTTEIEEPIDASHIPEELLPIVNYSRKVGWVKGIDIKRNVAGFKRVSTDEIRQYFLTLESLGCGQCRGEGEFVRYNANEA